jgi:hypothetical protein
MLGRPEFKGKTVVNLLYATRIPDVFVYRLRLRCKDKVIQLLTSFVFLTDTICVVWRADNDLYSSMMPLTLSALRMSKP